MTLALKLQSKELVIQLLYDNDWCCTFLNDGALAIHPLGRKKMLGKVIWDVQPDLKSTIFFDKFHEAMKTRKMVEVESYYPSTGVRFAVKIYPSANGLTICY